MCPQSTMELRTLRERLAPGLRTGHKSRSVHVNSATGNELNKLLQRLLKDGESSTVVIYGSPASGKSSFVEAMLETAKTAAGLTQPTVVRLNGVTNPDLKSAIKEICFTLDLQNELLNFVTDETHFEEKLEDVLAFLRTSLVSASKLSPIIFVLDHIELICEQPGQALLYNLFDIVQSKTSPICVIGTSRAPDILELFEKRVKSRFSHRILHLSSLTPMQFCDIAKELLSIPANQKWTADVENLFEHKCVHQILMGLHAMDSTIYALNSFLYDFVNRCDYELSPGVFEETFDDLTTDSVVKVALTLTVLDMLLVKAIQKFSNNRHPAFNFENLFQMVGRNSVLESLKASKADLLSALQTLENYRLITPLEKRSDKSQVYYRSEILPHQYDKIFKKYPKLPTIFQTVF